MADALIPVFSGAISGATVQLCDARTLHTFMQVRRDFSNWIKGRIRKFGFVANEDYLLTKSGEQVPHQGGTRTVERIDYHLTLDMAKELSMVENNDQGRAARRYFIECERKALTGQPSIPYSVHPNQTLSAEQAKTLRDLLTTSVKRLPQAKQAGAMVQGWSKLKAHFGTDYRHIPASEFHEAVSIVARHAAQWELVEQTPPPAPRPALPPGKMVVDRQKLAAIWKDLGVLRARIDGLGILESDLPPSWWAQHQISAG